MNTVHDIENEAIECTTKGDNCSPNCDREINNNNTSYLQLDREDKHDKHDKKSQQKTVKFSRCEEVVMYGDGSDKDRKLIRIEMDDESPRRAPSAAADKSDSVELREIDGEIMSVSNNEIPAKDKRRRDASDSEILKTEPNVKTNAITSSSAISKQRVSRPPPPPPPTSSARAAAAVEISSIGESPFFPLP